MCCFLSKVPSWTTADRRNFVVFVWSICQGSSLFCLLDRLVIFFLFRCWLSLQGKWIPVQWKLTPFLCDRIWPFLLFSVYITHARARARARARTHTHTHTESQTQRYVHTRTHTRTHARMHACAPRHANAREHTHTHTHNHRHMYLKKTLKSIKMLLCELSETW